MCCSGRNLPVLRTRIAASGTYCPTSTARDKPCNIADAGNPVEARSMVASPRPLRPRPISHTSSKSDVSHCVATPYGRPSSQPACWRSRICSGWHVFQPAASPDYSCRRTDCQSVPQRARRGFPDPAVWRPQVSRSYRRPSVEHGRPSVEHGSEVGRPRPSARSVSVRASPDLRLPA